MIHVKHCLLASRSQTRIALLAKAGVPVTAIDPAIDERAFEAALAPDNPSAAAIAIHLARAKALAVSTRHRDQPVIGADQTLALGSRHFAKPASRADARTQLQQLAGNTHQLHSAVTVALNGACLFETTTSASLSMRAFSDDFLDHYLDEAGDNILNSVGCYHYEGLGLHLFSAIDGDYHTILGLPLLPLLAFFREQGWSET